MTLADVTPTHILQGLHMPGVPMGALHLKVGAIVMIIRNLDKERKLVNGTIATVVKIGTSSVTVELENGSRAVLCRQTFVVEPEESGLPCQLQRRQFPITLKFAGIFFNGDAWCHGMLYVALSRVGCWSQVAVLMPEGADATNFRIKNCVYKNLVSSC
jgi:hypothetical protein